jgi:hypothetical protein
MSGLPRECSRVPANAGGSVSRTADTRPVLGLLVLAALEVAAVNELDLQALRPTQGEALPTGAMRL